MFHTIYLVFRWPTSLIVWVYTFLFISNTGEMISELSEPSYGVIVIDIMGIILDSLPYFDWRRPTTAKISDILKPLLYTWGRSEILLAYIYSNTLTPQHAVFMGWAAWRAGCFLVMLCSKAKQEICNKHLEEHMISSCGLTNIILLVINRTLHTANAESRRHLKIMVPLLK